MRINADFLKRVVIRPEDREWVPSPAGGVERCMLDRIGGEVARATSLVRFAPNSAFPTHTHGGGEEYLVLDGAFGDETGTFPAGTYVRNPIGTAHAPDVKEGCTIFVKLHQFASDDDAAVTVDTKAASFGPGPKEGVSVLHLYRHGDEHVRLIRFEPGAALDAHDHPGGEEVLVLDGTLFDEHGEYPTGTWLRHPTGFTHAPGSQAGCLVYVKSGHLTPDRISAFAEAA